MLATSPSQITLIHECHSFIPEKPTEKRNAPKRIPRPPNAFILYRSDFLKRRTVPPEVEKRQQNLSRIAGQCWNQLPETEKAIWFSKAAVIRAEHRAKYSSCDAGLFHKDTKRLSAKDRRRASATNPTHPFGRFRTRRTQTPYSESMFAALHDPKISSPESRASLLSATSPSESPSSTTASLSPFTLPDMLSPFTSPTHYSGQNSPTATFDNSACKFGYLLDSPGYETPQWGLSQISPSDVGPLREPFPPIQQFTDDFLLGVSFPDLQQLPEPRSDLAGQASMTLPGSNIFPPAGDFRFLSDDFNLMGDFAHFNQPLAPLYLWRSDELDTSNQRGL